MYYNYNTSIIYKCRAHNKNIAGCNEKDSKEIMQNDGKYYGYHNENEVRHYHQVEWDKENQKWKIVNPAVYYDENFNIIDAFDGEETERIEVEFYKKVDGDTEQFELNRKIIKVRFLGVNTPETVDTTTGLKINERLKVAVYAKVSTDSEDQLNSFESQVKYYNEKISQKLEWSLVEVYADESISGTQDYKRSNFMRMIADSMNGKIDLILTKSISRFARNILDTLKYVRMLKEKNVAILFEEENVNTLEMVGELLLTILSLVAQQESETISAHVK